MYIHELFSVAGVVIGLISYVFYLRGVFRQGAKPHAFTWLVWGIVMVVACAAQVSEKAGPGIWVTGISAAITIFITGIAFKRGETDVTRTDWIALIAALSAIPIWVMTSNPVYAVFLICLIDGIAYYPTFRKSWRKPWEEPALAYSLGGFQFFFGMLGLNVINLTTSLYPTVICILNLSLAAMLVLRRKILVKSAAYII